MKIRVILHLQKGELTEDSKKDLEQQIKRLTFNDIIKIYRVDQEHCLLEFEEGIPLSWISKDY